MAKKHSPTHINSLHEKDVRRYAKQGKLHEGVFGFLQTIGKNKGMAHGILRRKSENKLFWVGPINFSLRELARCTGTEVDMEYVQTPRKWNTTVNSMVKSIKTGWKPPVLIVNPRPWPTLSIRDGNHRYAALLQSGKRKYWTLFWFESKKDQSRFVKKYDIPSELVHSD